MIEYVFGLIFLLIISLIDIKLKIIPSILTNMFILLGILIIGFPGIYTGIIFFLLALILLEHNWFEGEQDLKVMVAVGILITNIFNLMIYFILFLLIGTGYKLIIKKKFRDLKEVPFIPVFLITGIIWFTLLLMGGLI